jgi:DNA-binding MarR family transcriptional regulator
VELGAEALRPKPDPLMEARRVWVEHGWDGADEMLAATSVMRAHQIIISRMDEVLRPRGLSHSRFEVLVLLYASRHGYMPLGRVSERLMVHPTSVTGLADRLEQDELIVREPSPTDRRGVMARITAKGRKVVEEVAPKLGAMKFGFDAIEPQRVPEVTAVLRALRHSAGDFDEYPD